MIFVFGAVPCFKAPRRSTILKTNKINSRGCALRRKTKLKHKDEETGKKQIYFLVLPQNPHFFLDNR